jgi:hypothetical protein
MPYLVSLLYDLPQATVATPLPVVCCVMHCSALQLQLKFIFTIKAVRTSREEAHYSLYGRFI